jgi:F-type H+-transporting ATPase subunit epsilon
MTMPLKLEIVTVEGVIFSGDVDMVVAPGTEGELGILPRHAPLMTSLTYGELHLKRGEDTDYYAIGGGFMEVLPYKVTIMADSAERADEIDLERAEAARRRAEEHLLKRTETAVDFAKAEAALRRSLARIKVAEGQKRRQGAGAPSRYPPSSE